MVGHGRVLRFVAMEIKTPLVLNLAPKYIQQH